MATEYTVQGNYGGVAGWEDLTSEDTRKEAKERLAEYRENSPEGTYRIKPTLGPGTYTAMSDDAIEATICAMQASGEHYPITLNPGDFNRFMWTLAIVANMDPPTKFHEQVSEWASGFASSIAETLGIEMI